MFISVEFLMKYLKSHAWMGSVELYCGVNMSIVHTVHIHATEFILHEFEIYSEFT